MFGMAKHTLLSCVSKQDHHNKKPSPPSRNALATLKGVQERGWVARAPTENVGYAISFNPHLRDGETEAQRVTWPGWREASGEKSQHVDMGVPDS